MTSWRTGKWAEPLEFRYPSWKENVSKCPLLPAKADTKELKFCNPFLNKILAVFECYGHAISCKGKTLHFAPASLWPFPILFFFRFLHEITTIIKLYWTLFFSWWTQFIFRIFAIFYCLCIFGFLKIRLQTTRVSSYFRIFVHFVYQLFGQTLVTRRWSKEDKCNCCIILKDCIKSEKNKSWPDCHSTQFYWSTENQRSLNKILRVSTRLNKFEQR